MLSRRLRYLMTCPLDFEPVDDTKMSFERSHRDALLPVLRQVRLVRSSAFRLLRELLAMAWASCGMLWPYEMLWCVMHPPHRSGRSTSLLGCQHDQCRRAFRCDTLSRPDSNCDHIGAVLSRLVVRRRWRRRCSATSSATRNGLGRRGYACADSPACIRLHRGALLVLDEIAATVGPHRSLSSTRSTPNGSRGRTRLRVWVRPELATGSDGAIRGLPWQLPSCWSLCFTLKARRHRRIKRRRSCSSFVGSVRRIRRTRLERPRCTPSGYTVSKQGVLR